MTTPSIPTPVRRPEPVFTSEEDLRRFINTATVRLQDLALDMELAAVQLQKYMGQIPDGTFVGLTSKVRAKMVASHLHLSARVVDVAASYINGAWLSYTKHYARERAGETA